jgi:hypothetical protein
LSITLYPDIQDGRLRRDRRWAKKAAAAETMR